MNARLIAAAIGQVWAIDPVKGQALAQLMVSGAVEAKNMTPGAEQKIAESPGNLTLIPVFGVMAQHGGMLNACEQMVSTDALGRVITAAAENEDVKAIILRVQSPGGSIYGLHELASRIREARDIKPVIAQVDSFAASAAYWMASQATEVVVTPGGDVGSIGVYALHEDISRMLDAEGVTLTHVYAGKYKVEGNPFEPLGEEAAATMQARVDSAYADFIDAVATGRGVDPGVVEDRFGKGRMVKAEEAVKRGMADRIATLDETIKRFTRPAKSGSNRTRRARLALAEQI